MNQKTRYDMAKLSSNTLAVIAGLTRNLPSDRDSSSRLGDGGCFSAMTGKGLEWCPQSRV